MGYYVLCCYGNQRFNMRREKKNHEQRRNRVTTSTRKQPYYKETVD